MTEAEATRDRMRTYMADRRRLERMVEIPAIVNMRRRKAAIKSLSRFAKSYYPEMFCKPWSVAHKACIRKMEYAVKYGGAFANALPRGEGKTTLCKVAGLWALFRASRNYAVLIAATEPKAERLLKDMKGMLRFSVTLAEDFPEICYPVQALEDKALKCRAQQAHICLELSEQLKKLYKLKKLPSTEPMYTEMTWTTKEIVLPTVHGSPLSGSCIEVAGITGDIRGRQRMRADGVIIRPDLAICDDPQTHASAKSPSQCKDREEIIRADIMGLAGPGEKITVFMTCTVIARDDLASRFLDTDRNPDWRGERHAMLTTWPEDMELWAEYDIERIQGLESEDKGRRARRFYRAHRKQLDKGASISWPARKHRSDVSAIQHAMDLYFRLGDKAFRSEYQNDPPEESLSVYELKPETVAETANGFQFQHVPIHGEFLTATIDVNRYGLHYTVLSTTLDFACAVIDYGKYPKSYQEVIWSEEEHGGKTEVQAIYEAVVQLCRELAARKYWRGKETVALDLLTVDCGYQMDTIFRAAHHADRTLPITVRAARGRASKYYRDKDAIGPPADNCYRARWKSKGPVLIHNADYWRERCQQTFLLEAGAPGSCSLYGTPDQHQNFADQICAEILREHVQGERVEFYHWVSRPGYMNDLLDSTVGAMAAASMLGARFDALPGISIAGPVQQPVTSVDNSQSQTVTIKESTICRI